MKPALVGALALVCAASPALAQSPSQCIAASAPKAAFTARGGSWIALTPEQWQFLRGVYVVNPETPPGLPYGDGAVLAQAPDRVGALVFFMDGDRACTPMPAPPELITMLKKVGAGEIAHEASN